MSVFDTALATLHADRNIAADATWRAQGNGPAVALRVVHTIVEQNLDAFGQQVNSANDMLHIRVADVAQVRAGDVVEVGGEIRYVLLPNFNRDHTGLVWLCPARRM